MHTGTHIVISTNIMFTRFSHIGILTNTGEGGRDLIACSLVLTRSTLAAVDGWSETMRHTPNSSNNIKCCLQVA